MGRRKKTEAIRSFIFENLEKYPKNIITATAEAFSISRQAAYRHMRNLINEGLIENLGTTRHKTYFLKSLSETKFYFPIIPEIKEDVVWRQRVSHILWMIPRNVFDICNHGFTEIMNNVIDHSEGKMVYVDIRLTMTNVYIDITDNGVGIFRKIQRDLHLEDQRHAILELSKGKLTTDPTNHTGEGIFFSSRMFDRFSIRSGELFFSYESGGDDWLIDASSKIRGTNISMQIGTRSTRTTQEVFDRFTVNDNGVADFSKTHVPVSLAKHGAENLVSRSQAKRLLARFEKFKEVFLDFSNVDTIGQAFADEIFRVFRLKHPEIELTWIRANDSVKKMIERIYFSTNSSPGDAPLP